MNNFHLSVAVGIRQQPKNRIYEQEIIIAS